MDTPDLSRTVETFLLIEKPPRAWTDALIEGYVQLRVRFAFLPEDYKKLLRAAGSAAPPTWQQYCRWQGYFYTLRRRVGPLVDRLMADGIVNWYAFVVHDRRSGVPTTKDDDRPYIHLRLALAPGVREKDLRARLGRRCRMTRRMVAPDPPYLDAVDISALRGGDVRLGWKLLGESSAWVLSIVKAHDPDRPMPERTIAQLLHYAGNQVMASQVGMPFAMIRRAAVGQARCELRPAQSHGLASAGHLPGLVETRVPKACGMGLPAGPPHAGRRDPAAGGPVAVRADEQPLGATWALPDAPVH